MFLESTYQPKQSQTISELSIMDIAILAAQIGDKPFLRKGSLEHLTVGQIQLVCYYAQGIHMTKTGRSFFKEDFYIVDGRIESPLVADVLGNYDKIITPFNIDKSLEKYLTNRDKGFTPDNNKLAQEIIYQYAPSNYKEVMKTLRETVPYKNALMDERNKVSKKDIKEFFENLLIRKTEISNPIIGE